MIDKKTDKYCPERSEEKIEVKHSSCGQRRETSMSSGQRGEEAITSATFTKHGITIDQ
jgi:hypothetical protein